MQKKLKVKSLVCFDLGQGGGRRYGSVVGRAYDLPESRALQLIRIGAAELVEEDTPSKPPATVAKKGAAKK